MRALVIASLMLLVTGPVVAATPSSSHKTDLSDHQSKSSQKHRPASNAKEGAALNAAAKKADNLKGPVIPRGDLISN